MNLFIILLTPLFFPETQIFFPNMLPQAFNISPKTYCFPQQSYMHLKKKWDGNLLKSLNIGKLFPRSKK